MAAPTDSPSPSSAVVSLAIPSPLPLPPPLLAAAPNPRRLVTPCWTHDETLALLDAYRDKWYALRRGNLRATDWQDVAADVARRCPSPSSPKTPVQCRHKIEKLRKRFRTERQKSLLPFDPAAPRRPISASSWVYFSKMEAMERGDSPLPAAAAALPPNFRHASPSPPQFLPPRPPSSSSSSEDEGDDDDGSDEIELNNSVYGNARGLQNLMGNGGPPSGGMPDPHRFGGVHKSGRERIPSPNIGLGSGGFFRGGGYGGGGEVKEEMEEMRRAGDARPRRREREESSAMGELASALRVLGDGFLRMEQRKMEMAREMEKARMEMELKHTELILDSQRRIVDAFVKGFLGRKKSKISPEE